MFYSLTMTLEQAFARFRRRRPEEASIGARVSAAAFRTAVELRLGNVERELGEVKGRVNGLIFLVAGTVVAQVVLKLVQ